MNPLEAKRITSPDGSKDAVVLEGGIDATSPYNYTVCIVAVGKSCDKAHTVAEVYGATRSAGAYGIDVEWQSSKCLEVRYLHANRSVLLHPSDWVSSAVVVTLKEGIENSQAPAGSMVKRV